MIRHMFGVLGGYTCYHNNAAFTRAVSAAANMQFAVNRVLNAT